ncbi:MAG TPA: CAP domain-containing protein [Solirubrobacteraceae bacterium]
MAPLRPFWLAALAALALGSSLADAPALGASAPVRHRAGCRATHHSRGHAGSIRVSHRPSSRRRHARCGHHARSHTKQHLLSGYGPHPGNPSGHAQALANGAGACQDGDLKPTPEDLQRIRAATLCLVNRERTTRGENALRPDAHLAQAAQAHTDSMSGGDYFDHTGPGGQTPLDRMRAAGYIYSSRVGYDIGENIAWGTGSLSTPNAIVAAWMASPGHRENILDPRYRDTAIGASAQPPRSLAHGQPGGIYTQDFGRIVTA